MISKCHGIPTKRKKCKRYLLNSTLRIHHDEELDDFASFRLKYKSLEDNTVHEHDPDDFEMSWDSDKEEEVQEVMHKKRRRGRGQRGVPVREVCWVVLIWGMVVHTENGNSRPVWKKPE
jgi:hypothetical protein